MKLTTEGMRVLNLHQARGFSLSSYRFNPNHFANCVVLPIEEAQTLQEILEYVYYNCSDPELESKSLFLFRYIKSTIKLIDHV